MPSGDRFQSGVLVQDQRRRLLVDCGSGVLHRLQQCGVGYEAVETVLLTHHHLDHVADLLPLMKARWLAGEASLTVVGPSRTTSLVEALLEVHSYMQDRLELEVREVGPGRHRIAGFDVEAVETRHSVPCLAYRLDDRLTISGDTEPSEDVVELADGCAVLVHECAFPDEIETSNHTRPSELAEVLRDVEVGRVYLTHLYPHCQGREATMQSTIAEAWGGDVSVAEDLLTVRVTREP
ncbi:MAG: MBL fold metallo-hydrolase [Halobacteriales archaeon]